ncbi:MAG TPA: hypothetical protein VNK04_11565 [Gemmataceae bacterium]|nr:hypothetical protein [Gemmataceae bacterium]
MAFHPFQTFRKHQKVIFAGLTIICMIVFVLSWGPGDVFERVASFFGAGRADAGNMVVTTLYGEKVTERELGRLQFQRRVANDFMRVAIAQGTDDLLRKAEGALSRFPTGPRDDLDRIIKMVRGLHALPNQLQLIRDQGQRQLQFRMVMMQYQLQMPGLFETLKNLIAQHPAEKELLNQLMFAVAQTPWLVAGGNEFYFGGSHQTGDLLDFLVWKRQADRLGITLTDDDVRAEINRQTLKETFQGDAFQDTQQIRRYLSQAGYHEGGRVTANEMYNALRDELRVGLAQSALLGFQSGPMGQLESIYNINEVPSVITPDQFWTYLKENRTTLKEVAFLPIPVKNFLDQVKKDPTEKELQVLFREYRDQEPSPDRDQPGFKQPRRIRVEWMSARPDSPHYQKLGRERMASVVASLAVPNPWIGVGFVLRLDQAYSGERLNNRDRYRLPAWTSPTYPLAFYPSLHEAGNLAATLGLLTTATLQGAPAGVPLGAVASYQAAAVARDAKTQAAAVAEEARERSRSPFGPAFVLAGTYRSPLAVAATLGALYDLDQQTERFLPLSLVAGQVLERLQKQQAENQMIDNLEKVRKLVETWRGRSREAAAPEVAKAVKEYGLEHRVMDRPLDQYEIEDDPAIQPLKKAMAGLRKPDEVKRFKIAPYIFTEAPLYTPQFAGRSDEQFLYWKIEDMPARVYPSYAEAPEEIKQKVKEAWKLQRARELARQAAQEVVAEARKLKSAADAVRYLRDQAQKHGWGEVFELHNIARLVPEKTIRPDMPVQYEPYKVPEEKINARPDFAEQLVKALNEPGDVTVVWNQPETVYYVAVLQQKESEERLEQEFLELYRKPSRDNPLLQRLAHERQQQYLKAVMEQLRAEAGAVNEKGEWVVDPEVRKRLDGRSRDEAGE